MKLIKYFSVMAFLVSFGAACALAQVGETPATGEPCTASAGAADTPDATAAATPTEEAPRSGDASATTPTTH